MSDQLAIDFGHVVEAVFYARTDAEKAEAHTRGLPDAATPVLVISNGSGRVLDLEDLFGALSAFTLDPKFRRYGNFRLQSEQRADVTEFFGNFQNISHVFGVRCLATSATARRLNDAIEANLATPAYATACVEDDKHQSARAGREAEEMRGRK